LPQFVNSAFSPNPDELVIDMYNVRSYLSYPNTYFILNAISTYIILSVSYNTK
jgi:hypothetical protein